MQVNERRRIAEIRSVLLPIPVSGFTQGCPLVDIPLAVLRNLAPSSSEDATKGSELAKRIGALKPPALETPSPVPGAVFDLRYNKVP